MGRKEKLSDPDPLAQPAGGVHHSLRLPSASKAAPKSPDTPVARAVAGAPDVEAASCCAEYSTAVAECT